MRTGLALWAAFLVFGALLYAESVGYWHHPVYRLVLMVTMLSWFGYMVWTPRPSAAPRPTL